MTQQPPAEAPAIQPASPEARRKALLTLAFGTLVGVGLLAWASTAREDAADLALRDPDAARLALVIWLRRLAIGFVVLMGVVCAWLGRLSWRIRTTERFPPPGMQTVRDTRILTGAKARGLGTAGLTLTVAVAVFSALAAGIMWVIGDML